MENNSISRKCGDCSRRKFYQIGYKDGLRESEKEFQELRDYKSKVEKFILRYESSVALLPEEVALIWNQCIHKLKEELGYDKSSKS